MKKTLGIAAAALVAGASLFAEGFSVDGFIRSGISIDPKGETVKTDTWLPGGYFGGGSRLRLNINYDGVNGGATFRYQKDADDEKKCNKFPISLLINNLIKCLYCSNTNSYKG